MDAGCQHCRHRRLLIGLAYGAVGLLSGFCLLSGLRGWWAEGDSRLIRTYALALGVAIVATQLLAAGGVVDLGKSIYLQPSFSAPLMFFGGLLFGYGMVLSNGCASRALVLLGRGNLRSFVVVIVIGIAAQMTLKGLIAPARIAVLQATQARRQVISLPALLSTLRRQRDASARMLGGRGDRGRADHLCVRACAVPARLGPDRGGRRGRTAGRGGMVCDRLSRRRRFQSGAGHLADLHRADRRYAAIRDAVDRADAEFRHRHGGRRVRRKPGDGARHPPLPSGKGFNSPRHMLRSIGGAALMGAGGAMAYGCSIGQGLTGLSTLALASFVAVAGILLGLGRRPARRAARAAAGAAQDAGMVRDGHAVKRSSASAPHDAGWSPVARNASDSAVRSQAASRRDSRGALPSA